MVLSFVYLERLFVTVCHFQREIEPVFNNRTIILSDMSIFPNLRNFIRSTYFDINLLCYILNENILTTNFLYFFDKLSRILLLQHHVPLD